MNIDELNQLLSKLPQACRIEQTFANGDIVFEQGAPCGGLWLVRSGRVDLQRVTESGHLVLIHRAQEAESFAEASIFSPDYHCTARVVQAGTVLIEVQREALLAVLKRDSIFALSFSILLAKQVQSYRRQVEVLSIRKADQRVFEAMAHGMLGDDIKAFAARIGLSHEVVYRVLARLAERGQIRKIERGRYIMANKR